MPDRLPTGTPHARRGGLPDREQLRAFIENATGRIGKREISREFGLGPEHRQALRQMLREMALDGTLAPAGARRFRVSDRLPESMVVQVTGTDADGDPVARPVQWDGEGVAPVVFMHPELRGRAALAPGERVVARLRRIGPGKYEGRTLRRLTDAPMQVVGLFRTLAADDPATSAPARFRPAGRLTPADRRAKAQWVIPQGEDAGAPDNEIVIATPLPQAGPGLHPARIIERLGPQGDARTISMVAIAMLGIPHAFPTEALAQAEAARAVSPAGRTDLRDMPLVTIDGDDARDFDDAIYAEPDGTGFRITVAIADVAWYVRPGTALDREARLRGNSVYFPDRVIPMLPEALSNGWCSLRPGEDRGCLFVTMDVAADGTMANARFGRGIMRSAARLTYEQVQAARDGAPPDAAIATLPDGLLDSLFGAWRCLAAARAQRGTLDLDLPERLVRLNDQGQITAIAPRIRLDSHRVVEEFMIAANVAAARCLEGRHLPCLYRIHAPPTPERLENLRHALDTMGLKLPPVGSLRAADLDRILQQARNTDQAALVNELVLRAQNQAEYSPDPIGHFGLSLAAYSHFTSPIRRYADLLTHRALLVAIGLEPGPAPTHEALEDAGEAITRTERRAAQAERETLERYAATWLQVRVGTVMEAHVSSLSRFGIFTVLDATGTSALLPMSALPQDQWHHDEKTQTLLARDKTMAFRPGQALRVRIEEACAIRGTVLLALPDSPPARQGRRA
ncbi:VacB/RNase II family 3'-5' exoribonuclease [Komagataeibacter medellinensis]|uniref:Ribonuclease R n=1 Tax=Komagataeibacter medellinensis TaxID=1177712 RepID=A0ABQ6W196_9PROT|nr:VacB/RNase II family 3'-5' exoribonuclease [Komagataeibacter medellinensis]KAB8124493.1 VacB/RNase II family 3'-5' exoribonuclease [Komagataeibacter medellinensis]